MKNFISKLTIIIPVLVIMFFLICLIEPGVITIIFKSKPKETEVLYSKSFKNKYCKLRGHVFTKDFEMITDTNRYKIVDSIDITYEIRYCDMISTQSQECKRCNQYIFRDSTEVFTGIVWSKCSDTIKTEPYSISSSNYIWWDIYSPHIIPPSTKQQNYIKKYVKCK